MVEERKTAYLPFAFIREMSDGEHALTVAGGIRRQLSMRWSNIVITEVT